MENQFIEQDGYKLEIKEFDGLDQMVRINQGQGKSLYQTSWSMTDVRSGITLEMLITQKIRHAESRKLPSTGTVYSITL